MTDLLRKPFGTHGKVHEITPQSAGWRYVGFSLWRLRAGESAAEHTGEQEVILVLVEGKARITGAGRGWGILGERMDVGRVWEVVEILGRRSPSAEISA